MAKKAKSKKVTPASTGSSSFKVRPLGDRVLVREIKGGGEKSVSGIIIPETVDADRGAKKG